MSLSWGSRPVGLSSQNAEPAERFNSFSGAGEDATFRTSRYLPPCHLAKDATHADAKTGKTRTGGFGDRPGLHGDELFAGAAQGCEGNDGPAAPGGGAW